MESEWMTGCEVLRTRGNWALKTEQQRDQQAASSVREAAAIRERHARSERRGKQGHTQSR